MLQQAIDFRTESEALYQLLEPLSGKDFKRRTQFNGWTINQILQHLHHFNYAADLSLTDEDAIVRFFEDLREQMQKGATLVGFTAKALDGLEGRALLETWRDFYLAMSERFAAAEPKRRLKWGGPDMSVLSSITARLMETWAHGQEVYDLLGVLRKEHDHIRNIVVIGNNTFAWTFANRGEEVPQERPYLKLTAPSGALWEYNDPGGVNHIEGRAAEFCQVVTQTRNIHDTKLKVVGEVATKWMAQAQCFAGAPRTPPAPGTRHRET